MNTKLTLRMDEWLIRAAKAVTRNQRDFRHASLKVLGPDELLASLPR